MTHATETRVSGRISPLDHTSDLFSIAMNKAKTALVRAWCVLTLGAILLPFAAGGASIDSGFSYQGRLYDQGSPAGGVYSMQFVLRDSGVSGTQVGNILTNNSVLVTNGLFQVILDFGPGVWNGDKRWLEIGVRTNLVDGFTLLDPTQPIVVVPYANYAVNAANLIGNLPTNQLSGTFPGQLSLVNPANQLAGNGALMTQLNASQLATGTVPDARLSAVIARSAELIATNNALVAQLTALNSALTGALTTSSNALRVSLLAEGQARTNLQSQLLTGDNSFAGNNAFSGSNHYSGIVTVTNSANQVAGNGSLLTALNATQLTTGTVPDARIAATIARSTELNSVSNTLNTALSGSNTSLLNSLTTTSNGLSGRLLATNTALLFNVTTTSNGLNTQIANNNTAATTAIATEGAARTNLQTQLLTGANTLSGNNVFSGSNHYSGIVTVTNSANKVAGDGSMLTVLNAGQLTTGTVPDARLSSAISRSSDLVLTNNALVALINANGSDVTTTSNGLSSRLLSTNTALLTTISDASNVLSGRLISTNSLLVTQIGANTSGLNTTSNGLSSRLIATNSALLSVIDSSSNVLSGRLISTNSLLVSDINSSSNALRTSILSEGSLRTNFQTQLLTGDNTFSGSNHFSGVINATNTTNTFVGDGSGLTGLNAAQLGTGTIPDARLSANVVQLSGTNVFAGTNRFTGTVLLTNSGNVFVGDGSGLNNLPGSGWGLTGNAITSEGTSFLGTTDDKNLDARVNNIVAMRLEAQAVVSDAPNVVLGLVSGHSTGTGNKGVTLGGGSRHTVAASSTFATVSGGDDNNISGDYATISGGQNHDITSDSDHATVGGGSDNNIATSPYGMIAGGRENNINGSNAGAIAGGNQNNLTSSQLSFIGGGNQNSMNTGTYSVIGGGDNNKATNSIYMTIGGGKDNTVSATASTVSGGRDNTASGTYSAVAGGRFNIASGVNSVIAGGLSNTNGTNYGTIGGGLSNTNNGQYGTIPGGTENEVSASYGFAAGRRAKANHAGAFVWADSTAADFASGAIDSFNVRANGGIALTSSGTFTFNGNDVLTNGSGAALSGNNTFTGNNVFNTGSNHFSGIVTLTNTANTLAGSGANLSGLWKIGGNAGNTASDFIGTTDDQDLVLKVFGVEAFRLDSRTTTSETPNILMGKVANHSIAASLQGVTLSGGDNHDISGTAGFATVGGGQNNNISGTNSTYSTIGGGAGNSIDGLRGVIAGGSGNSISEAALYSSILGGNSSSIVGGEYNTVGGGESVSINVTGTQGRNNFLGGGRTTLIDGNSSYNVLAGGRDNNINVSQQSFVGGGRFNKIVNAADAVVVGGTLNTNSGGRSFIGAGQLNLIAGAASSIVGGDNNEITASGTGAGILGGNANRVNATQSSIGGGQDNTNSGSHSFIGGGRTNMIASGATYSVVAGGAGSGIGSSVDYGFAAGRRAQANHDGSFVWADSTDSDFASSASDTFNVRAQGGVNYQLSSGTFAISGGNFTYNGSDVVTAGTPAVFTSNNSFSGSNHYSVS